VERVGLLAGVLGGQDRRRYFTAGATRVRIWLAEKGVECRGIDRVLADGRAALNRAVKWEELSKAPHILSNPDG